MIHQQNLSEVLLDLATQPVENLTGQGKYVFVTLAARGGRVGVHFFDSFDEVWEEFGGSLRQAYQRRLEKLPGPVESPAFLVADLVPISEPLPFHPWTTTFVFSASAFAYPQLRLEWERLHLILQPDPPYLVETYSLISPIPPTSLAACPVALPVDRNEPFTWKMGYDLPEGSCARAPVAYVRTFADVSGGLYSDGFGFCEKHVWDGEIFRPLSYLKHSFGTKTSSRVSRLVEPVSTQPLVGVVYRSKKTHHALVLRLGDYELPKDDSDKPDGWLALVRKYQKRGIPIYRLHFRDTWVPDVERDMLPAMEWVSLNVEYRLFERLSNHMVRSSRRVFSNVLDYVRNMDISAYAALVPGGTWWGAVGSINETKPVVFGTEREDVERKLQEAMAEVASFQPEPLELFVPPAEDIEDIELTVLFGGGV